MQIINSISSPSFINSVKNSNFTKITSVEEELSRSLLKENTETSTKEYNISLPIEAIKEKINNLNDIKKFARDILVNGQAIFFDVPVEELDKSFEEFFLKLSKKESKNASGFLNPNQKFYTISEKNSYLSKIDSQDINPLLLSEEEQKIYFNNLSKAMSNEFDKKGEFDKVLDILYFSKEGLDSKNKVDILNKISEKILEASNNNISLNKKDNLVNDIKDMIKGFDEEFESLLTEGLDDVLQSHKADLQELTSNKININSIVEAKDYLAKMEKLDSDFESLSEEQKENYLDNKYNVLLAFKSEESSFSLNLNLDTKNLLELNSEIKKAVSLEERAFLFNRWFFNGFIGRRCKKIS